MKNTILQPLPDLKWASNSLGPHIDHLVLEDYTSRVASGKRKMVICLSLPDMGDPEVFVQTGRKGVAEWVGEAVRMRVVLVVANMNKIDLVLCQLLMGLVVEGEKNNFVVGM